VTWTFPPSRSGLCEPHPARAPLPLHRLPPLLPWTAAFLVLLALPAAAARAAPAPTAEEIFARSQAVNPGEDQQSRLTLLIKDADGNSRKVVIKRLWKRYEGKDGLVSKVLLFHEYPPESRGTAFMVWTHTDASGLPPDQWIYIPILRKVNKLPGQLEENLQGSDLRASDMDPRPAALDDHNLLRTEKIGSKEYYVIESTPREPEKTYPYSKIVRWISTDDYLIDKVDYYDRDGRLLKKQTIAWKQMGDAWVWQKVVIANVQTGSQTTLNLTDIHVNQGIKDALFTERMMEQGSAALR
jgi:hypothetical protein